ncbi:MAG: HD-GYP domain-containing protein [Phycisphaerales bacterium]|nr:HD-GYP domain-containing protein [Phycisphaerales bacterium]
MNDAPDIVRLADEALRAMQASLVARDLYCAEHPAVRLHEERAAASLSAALAAQAEIGVVAFEDRVVLGNTPLPAGRELLPGLFARLRERGSHALLFRRGVDLGQLRTVLAALAAPGAGLPDVPGIAFAHVDGVRTSGAAGGGHAPLPTPRQGRTPRAQSEALARLWAMLREHGQSQPDVVDSIVAEICAAVAVCGGAMAPLAELKSHDEYTFVHTINVGVLSAALAEAVGLGTELVHDVTAGALLHDVGKQAMPPEILNKNGQLNDEELAIMRRHPVEGARMLYGARHVPDTARIIALEHHMHIDGTGYPAQPPGWRIALQSQIVQIADVFDALRTDRPYRSAMPLDGALAILQKNAGKWFDEQLLAVFIERVVGARDRAAA